MNRQTLRVVIPTSRAEPDLLRRTLRSLSDCILPESFAGVLVIENGRRSGAASVAAEFAEPLRCRYLYSEPANKSAALNLVLDLVEDELLLFLDDDVRVSAELLMLYADAAREAPYRAFFGGPVQIDYEAPPPPWVYEALPASARGWTGEGGDDRFFMGCNWAAFARDIRAAGGFNSLFGPGSQVGAVGQETDMQRRLLASGPRPYLVRGAVVWHWVPASRCTPEWALDRAFQHGKSMGLNISSSRRLFGLPETIVRLIIRQSLREVAAACSFSKTRRFMALRWRRFTAGAISGWSVSRALRPRP